MFHLTQVTVCILGALGSMEISRSWLRACCHLCNLDQDGGNLYMMKRSLITNTDNTELATDLELQPFSHPIVFRSKQVARGLC